MKKLLKYILDRQHNFAYYYSLCYTLDTMTGIYHKWYSRHVKCHMRAENMEFLSEYDLTLRKDIEPCYYCIKN